MPRDPHPEITHDAWLTEVTAALGVPRDEVDVPAILRLASEVSHHVARPMVPVSAFLLGLAAGRGDAPVEELLSRLAQTYPDRSEDDASR